MELKINEYPTPVTNSFFKAIFLCFISVFNGISEDGEGGVELVSPATMEAMTDKSHGFSGGAGNVSGLGA